MALTSNKNFLSANGFVLSIDKTKYPNAGHFCSKADHPDVSVATAPANLPGLQHVTVGDALQYGQLTTTIILDEDMLAYKEMNDWLAESVAASTPVLSDITLNILNSSNNSIGNMSYKDAFPVSISGLQFDTTSTTYLTFDVTFSFSRFEFIN